MTLQVLVATMNESDHSLLEKMHIDSDALIGNQCDRNEVEAFQWAGHNIVYYSMNERGVGLNRNTTLMRATADIVLFADDDVIYCDDYEKIVLEAYGQNPDADLIIFNVRESRGNEPQHDTVTRNGRAGRRHVSKYGTFCVSARTESLRKKGISFHLLFGGGARYGCGEDTIFLQDCEKRKLRIYECTSTIGTVNHTESTWFNGYTEKYFYDKGALFCCMYPKCSKFIAVFHVLKHYSGYKSFGIKLAIKSALKGINAFAQN